MQNNLENRIKIFLIRNNLKKSSGVIENRIVIENYLKLKGTFVNTYDPYGEENWNSK